MTEITITVPVTLRDGEEVRFAVGPGFLRIDVRAAGRDRVKLDAIRSAQAAGILTEDEARSKQSLLGLNVCRSELIGQEAMDRTLVPLDALIERKVKACLQEVRERVDAEGLSR